MKLLRSWPFRIPQYRAHVVDGIQHLVIDRFDYRNLDLVDDDVLLIEWDLAVSREDLAEFADRCRKAPECVLVAPYLLYNPDGPVWAHRRYREAPEPDYVYENEPICHLFGFGLTYLPRDLVKAFLETQPRTFTDTSFSEWHHANVEHPEVPIAWDIRPIHLHYKLPEELT